MIIFLRCRQERHGGSCGDVELKIQKTVEKKKKKDSLDGEVHTTPGMYRITIPTRMHVYVHW